MPIQTFSIKQLGFLQLGIGMVLALVAGWIGGIQLAASTVVGVFLMVLNVTVLGWSWQRLLEKKSIAWTVLVIVIKYAVLLGSIYILGKTQWFSVLGAGIGVASLVLAALVFAAIDDRKVSGKFGSL